MDSKFIRGAAVGALVAALSLLVPSDAESQTRSGVEIWEATCSRCHMLQPTNKYYPKDWRSVGTHMAITARLTSVQADAVVAFLVSGARTDQTAALPPTLTPSRPASASVELDEDQAARLEAYIRRLQGVSTRAVTGK